MLEFERLRGWLPIMALVGVLTLVPAVALADFTPLDNSSQIPDPEPVITFDLAPPGFILDPDLLIGEGIRFPDAPDGEFILFDGSNKLLDVTDGQVLIDFVGSVGAAGIDYGAATTLTFTAYDGLGGSGSVIGSTTSVGTSGFFGIDAGPGTLIQSILVEDGAGSFNLDNLLFSHVPVPGAVVLGAIGLGLVGWVSRRRFG